MNIQRKISHSIVSQEVPDGVLIFDRVLKRFDVELISPRLLIAKSLLTQTSPHPSRAGKSHQHVIYPDGHPSGYATLRNRVIHWELVQWCIRAIANGSRNYVRKTKEVLPSQTLYAGSLSLEFYSLRKSAGYFIC